MSALLPILAVYRATSRTEREKGTYFEELRILPVKAYADFRASSQAGRHLAHRHLNYETVPCYDGVTIDYGSAGTPARTSKQGGESATIPTRAGMPALQDYRVVKMKFAKTRDPETNKSVPDKTTVIYNERLTIRHIPLEVYDCIVNGKPALDGSLSASTSPPTKPAASPTTPTSGPPKPWATPSIPWSSSYE